MHRRLAIAEMPLWALSLLSAAAGVAVVAALGCQSPLTVRGQNNGFRPDPIPQPGVPTNPWVASVPTEKDKITMPTYTIEPPDILLIDAVKLVPKSPYHIESLDVVQISVTGTLLDQPISGQYPVDPSGLVDLGPAYGKVSILNQTVDEAQKTIEKHLRKTLKEPEVSVSLGQTAGQQQISGDHLVGPDGNINLGTYGVVRVVGLTVNEAKLAIEEQLKNYLEAPRVSVDIYAYNSKVYYIITDGAGQGDTLVRIPITGNETVLDALAQVNGVSRLSSKNIWIARPAPGGVNCDQILPVNWAEITRGAATATNYQVLPGDRIFIAADKMIALDTFLDKATNPFERVFGFGLLSAQGIQVLNRFPKGGGIGTGT